MFVYKSVECLFPKIWFVLINYNLQKVNYTQTIQKFIIENQSSFVDLKDIFRIPDYLKFKLKLIYLKISIYFAINYNSFSHIFPKLNFVAYLMDLSAFQASTHYNKNNIDLDQYHIDKENCNVHQPRVAERHVLQPKNIHYNPLSEITDEISTQSTKESSPDYDQTSILGANIFQSFNNINQHIQKNCQHLNIMTQRCSYCKDCGSFLPKVYSFHKLHP